jgi:hypothetical protein
MTFQADFLVRVFVAKMAVIETKDTWIIRHGPNMTLRIGG